MNNKRQRSENWRGHDKVLLKALIMEKHEAIENRNSDAISNAKKVEAWTEVQNCFNSMCKGGRRTIAQLKSQWGTIKSIDKLGKKMKMEGGMSTTSFRSDDGTVKPLQQEPDGAKNIEKCHSQVFNAEIESDSDTDQSSKSSADLKLDMMQFEQKCRRELYSKKMENEAIKKENLLIEQRLLRKKIDYYEEKIKEWVSD